MRKFHGTYLTLAGRETLGQWLYQKEKRGRRKHFVQKQTNKQTNPENFPNLGQKLGIQIHETKRIPNYIHTKESSPKHIVLKLSKVNDKEF